MFHEFTTFFHTGLADILVNMIHDSTPDRFKFEWSFLTAQFASWARQTKTNKDRIRFYGDLRHLALKHNVLDLLPAIRLQPTDVGLAHLTTKYATDHYFALSYLRKRIWALSPIVITDNKASDVFPLTKRVLEGITRLREIKHPLGVVLGKDTLAYFNSSLNSNQNYLDLLFYTFDLICTTICSRSGALAPDLSDPDRIHAIITLDQLKIGKTWLKEIGKTFRSLTDESSYSPSSLRSKTERFHSFGSGLTNQKCTLRSCDHSCAHAQQAHKSIPF